eukprot:7985940-Alexandrium_andersonii.AAC.1
MSASLVGSEMCIRDSLSTGSVGLAQSRLQTGAVLWAGALLRTSGMDFEAASGRTVQSSNASSNAACLRTRAVGSHWNALEVPPNAPRLAECAMPLR